MPLGKLIFALLAISLTASAIAKTAKDEAVAMVDSLANFRFDQLGHPQIQSDSIAPVLAASERPHKLLIVPVRFPDTGYDRFKGDPAQDGKNREYFQQLLFAGGARAPEQGTLSHYYRHQTPRPGGASRRTPGCRRDLRQQLPLRWLLRCHRERLPGEHAAQDLCGLGRVRTQRYGVRLRCGGLPAALGTSRWRLRRRASDSHPLARPVARPVSDGRRSRYSL